MAEASFSGFLRTLLIILLVYYAVRFLMRVLIPMLFRSQRPPGQHGGNTNQHQTKSKSKKNDKDSKLGDYVDFEEID